MATVRERKITDRLGDDYVSATYTLKLWVIEDLAVDGVVS